MELVLLLHISQYDETLERFRSTSFERSSDSGISVFAKDCAEEKSGSICAHARAFYGNVAGEPPIFWVFDEGILPAGYVLEKVESSSGDDCHHNIEKLSDQRAKKFFKRLDHPIFEICDGNNSRQLTLEDIQVELAKFREQAPP